MNCRSSNSRYSRLRLLFLNETGNWMSSAPSLPSAASESRPPGKPFVPVIRPDARRPSASVTSIRVASCTTWLLVRINPSGVNTKPEPPPRRSRGSPERGSPERGSPERGSPERVLPLSARCV